MRLGAPNITTLRAGRIVHRVHDRACAPSEFNPCKGGQTRFAPITDSKIQCVSSLCAGSTVEATIYETIFHDVPAKAEVKTVPKAIVETRAHGALEVRRDLALARLSAVDLKKWCITPTALIASPPKFYAETAVWAKAIHDQFEDIDGLVWTSNHCDPDDAYLFFGARISAVDFTVRTSRGGSIDATFLADVRAAGRRGGITITL